MNNQTYVEPRTKALETFLKQHHSYRKDISIAGSGSVFDVEGMMFYVLKENEVKDTVSKCVSGFIKNVEKVNLCPKRFLARFDHQEHKIDDYLIYRMV